MQRVEDHSELLMKRKAWQLLVDCASVRYTKSRKDVLSIVQQILYSRSVVAEVSKGGWDSFWMRHPNLTLSHTANDVGAINKYFDLLEDTVHDNSLTNRTAQIATNSPLAAAS